MHTFQIDHAFCRALEGEDDLGVVVRAHIHIESKLINFINEKLTDLKTLNRLRYSQRVELACELGLNSEMKEPLKVLGEIRNNFAHKINAQLNNQNIDKFIQVHDSKTQNLFQSAYVSSGSNMLKDCPRFINLSPKDKFVIIVVILKARAEFELIKKKL